MSFTAKVQPAGVAIFVNGVFSHYDYGLTPKEAEAFVKLAPAWDGTPKQLSKAVKRL